MERISNADFVSYGPVLVLEIGLEVVSAGVGLCGWKSTSNIWREQQQY